MISKFHDNTIVTKFIKYLVANSYVPNIKIKTPTTQIIRNNYYIYNGNIVKYNSTNENDYKIIQPYNWGDKVKGFTSNYIVHMMG